MRVKYVIPINQNLIAIRFNQIQLKLIYLVKKWILHNNSIHFSDIIIVDNNLVHT